MPMGDVKYFMNNNYRVALQYDPEGYWIAEHPELPGCKADGETAQEALTSLDVSRELWIESRLASGLDVPEPECTPQYSGKFVLRIAKSMHRELVQEAEAEGVSLNTHISNLLANRHARSEQTYAFLQSQSWSTNWVWAEDVQTHEKPFPDNVLQFRSLSQQQQFPNASTPLGNEGIGNTRSVYA